MIKNSYDSIKEDYKNSIFNFLEDKSLPDLKKNLANIVNNLREIGIENAELDLPDAEDVMNYTEEELGIFNAEFLSRYFNLF